MKNVFGRLIISKLNMAKKAHRQKAHFGSNLKVNTFLKKLLKSVVYKIRLFSSLWYDPICFYDSYKIDSDNVAKFAALFVKGLS